MHVYLEAHLSKQCSTLGVVQMTAPRYADTPRALSSLVFEYIFNSGMNRRG